MQAASSAAGSMQSGPMQSMQQASMGSMQGPSMQVSQSTISVTVSKCILYGHG